MKLFAKTGGFTLMEVLVALAVLGASSVVFCRFAEGFLQLQGAERRQARAFLCASQTMELLVQEPPSCLVSGQFPACSEDAFYTLSSLPGFAPLLLAEVSVPAFHTVKLRRLVPCVSP